MPLEGIELLILTIQTAVDLRLRLKVHWDRLSGPLPFTISLFR
jgi:hypothetical protein